MIFILSFYSLCKMYENIINQLSYIKAKHRKNFIVALTSFIFHCVFTQTNYHLSVISSSRTNIVQIVEHFQLIYALFHYLWWEWQQIPSIKMRGQDHLIVIHSSALRLEKKWWLLFHHFTNLKIYLIQFLLWKKNLNRKYSSSVDDFLHTWLNSEVRIIQVWYIYIFEFF